MLVLATAIPSIAQEEVPERMKVGDEAPELFVSEWIKGGPVRTFEKGKVYLVDISIVFCPGCITIIPKLTDVAKKYRDELEVFVVYTMNEPKRVEKFVSNMGDKMDYGVAVDVAENRTMKAWGVQAFPTCFIVNQEGKIAYIHVGDHDMTAAVESILKTGRYDEVDGMLGSAGRINQRQINHDVLLAKLDALKVKGDYREVVRLVDSALLAANHEEKYHIKTGLVPEKFMSSLILADSVTADQCLVEIMGHTEENDWVSVLGLISNALPPSTPRLPQLNYERFLDVADRAANDAGGSYRVQRMCQKAVIMYKIKADKTAALSVLADARLIAKKHEIQDEMEWVEQTKNKIERWDEQRQQANADWSELMLLFDNQMGTDYQQKEKDLGWAELQLYGEIYHRNLLNKAYEFWDKYRVDERRDEAKTILLQAHMGVLLPWIDTARMTPELMKIINQRLEKANEDYLISQPKGKRIATGPPVFRMLPRDVEAEAE